MRSISTTRMSSKGQIVIPEEIRKALKLHTGDQFVVLGEKDVVILKIVTSPSMSEFDHLVKKTRKQAAQARLKKSDVKAAIIKARKK